MAIINLGLVDPNDGSINDVWLNTAHIVAYRKNERDSNLTDLFVSGRWVTATEPFMRIHEEMNPHIKSMRKFKEIND